MVFNPGGRRSGGLGQELLLHEHPAMGSSGRFAEGGSTRDGARFARKRPHRRRPGTVNARDHSSLRMTGPSVPRAMIRSHSP